MKPIIVSLAVLAAPHAGHPVALKHAVDGLAPRLRPLYADGSTSSIDAPHESAAYASLSDRRVQALIRGARTLRFENGGVGLMLDFHW